jgi:NAD(P)-dependent dehydrogenase (short-subunit alcohol dehydrogenase family)
MSVVLITGAASGLSWEMAKRFHALGDRLYLVDRDAGQLARAIITALEKRQPTLFPDRFTWLSSLFWRLAPALYHRLMRRRFAVELQQE